VQRRELIAMPLILAVSQRSLAAGGVGVTDRASGERRVLSVDEVASSLPRWPKGPLTCCGYYLP